MKKVLLEYNIISIQIFLKVQVLVEKECGNNEQNWFVYPITHNCFVNFRSDSNKRFCKNC